MVYFNINQILTIFFAQNIKKDHKVHRKDRSSWLKLIRNELGLSQKELAKELGIKQSTYSHMEKGEKSNLSIDHCNVLVDRYGVNPYYLLNGNPPYFIDNKYDSFKSPPPTNITIRTESFSESFLVPISAQDGYINTHPQDNNIYDKVVIPGMKDPNSRVFEISGDSMNPILLHGDFVACIRIEHHYDIRDGLLYVVVSNRSGIMVKYLREMPDGLLCISENETEHKHFVLDFDDIKELWEVRIRITKQIVSRRYNTQLMTNKITPNVKELAEKLIEQIGFKGD